MMRRMPHGADAAPPRIVQFSIRDYKAFHAPVSIHLGRITILLGRNNSGKSALCFAPVFFAHALRRDAEAPFPTSWKGIDFGGLASVTFRRNASGFSGRLGLAGAGDVTGITIGAAVAVERGHEMIINRIAVERADGTQSERTTVPWSEARALLAAAPTLEKLPDGIHVLRGQRPAQERYPRYLGYTPASVGPVGEHAPMILAAAGKAGLDEVNSWLAPLRVQLRIDSERRRKSDDFEILAVGPHGHPVNIVDSGAGLAQVLPLVVAVLLAAATPTLLCLEQPELQLHPHAHAAVADLLLESLIRRPETRLLVETHSDVLVLRLRRAIAEGRIAPGDVRIYFIDEDSSEGSHAREIVLNDRAIPDWWPKGVFAESQKEYFAMRRELAKRGSRE